MLTLLLLGCCGVVYAQNYTISGVVRDSLSGETMIGVNIIADGSNRGASTDSKGNYRLSLPKGNHTISVSYVGYTAINYAINLTENTTLDFALISNTTIGEVVVQTTPANRNITAIAMGTEQISMSEVKKLPALMGEVDILKAITLFAGVQNTSEGSSGFSVRGGSPDQNLILLDNTPVYNASHLMGFFSVFNNDAIEGLELYKGDLPLRYGGRISSLLDVKSRSEIPEHYFQSTGGIGVISMMEGLITEDINWLIAGRRSYADIFLALSPNPSLEQAKIYFYDLNGKLTWRINRRNILEASAYHGNDTFGADVGQFDYGNTAAALTWKHFFTDDILLNTSFNYTNYGYDVGGEIAEMSVKWGASIDDLSFRIDTDHTAGDDWKLNYGAQATYHVINPGTIVTNVLAPQILPSVYAWENAIYASSEHTIGEWLSVRYGVRGVLFDNGTQNFYAAEPRIGAVFMLSESSSIKANYSLNTQFIQVANNSASGSPMDVWFPSSENIPPQRAHTAALGYFPKTLMIIIGNFLSKDTIKI